MKLNTALKSLMAVGAAALALSTAQVSAEDELWREQVSVNTESAAYVRGMNGGSWFIEQIAPEHDGLEANVKKRASTSSANAFLQAVAPNYDTNYARQTDSEHAGGQLALKR